MLDTLNMRIGAKAMGGECPLKVEKYIRVDKSGVYNKSGMPYIVGHINNYRIYADNNAVHLSGSIAKLSRGENVNTTTREDVANGLQILCDSLHLDVGKANVSRVDVASTFEVFTPISSYIAQMSNLPNATRVNIGNDTVYFFRNNNRVLCFYDKRAELLRHNAPIPPSWIASTYMLRYELRLFAPFIQHIGLSSLKASDLLLRQPVARLADLWAQEYLGVTKMVHDVFKGVRTSNAATEAMLADLISYVPFSYLEETCLRVHLESDLSKTERYRWKCKIKDILRKYRDPLFSELDSEIQLMRTCLEGW